MIVQFGSKMNENAMDKKKAKQAVDLAKENDIDYSATTELIEKIIDEM